MEPARNDATTIHVAAQIRLCALAHLAVDVSHSFAAFSGVSLTFFGWLGRAYGRNQAAYVVNPATD